jgi:hypothetical protein
VCVVGSIWGCAEILGMQMAMKITRSKRLIILQNYKIKLNIHSQSKFDSEFDLGLLY